MIRPHIELHIGELILHGFAPHSREALHSALEKELARLLTQDGLQTPSPARFPVASHPSAGKMLEGQETRLAREVHAAISVIHRNSTNPNP